MISSWLDIVGFMGTKLFSREYATLSDGVSGPVRLSRPTAKATSQGLLETKATADVSTVPVQLSVVIPAFNEEAIIASTISQLLAYLDMQDKSYEVIISDDGSCDQSSLLVRQIIAGNGNVRLIREHQNHGKGAAVRRGIMTAGGELILFMDADLSYPVETISLCVDALQNYDIAIGSRNLPGSDIEIRPSLLRQLTGPLFKAAVSKLVISGYSDTQCGFKGFRAGAAFNIFSNCSINGFAFDVEVLALARVFGYSVTELPVSLIVDSSDSKINLTTDPLKMFGELMQIRRKMKMMSRPDTEPLRLRARQYEMKS
ncbi:MAG: dolichyl-phosphate beta-glucosyltransferase [Thermoleophilia bacterium]